MLPIFSNFCYYMGTICEIAGMSGEGDVWGGGGGGVVNIGIPILRVCPSVRPTKCLFQN